VTLLGDNIGTLKRNTDPWIDASKEVGLKVKVEKTKYMFMFRYQNADQNRDIKIANTSHENVSQFKYLGMNSGDACYHSVQNLLSSHLLSKSLKFRIHKTIILPVVLYGCETWSLTLREEHKMRVFKNRVLRRISGPTRDEVMGGWRKLHNKELHDCTLRQIYLELSSRGGWGGRGIWSEWGRRGTCIGCW
jgi:hypothetical protein